MSVAEEKPAVDAILLKVLEAVPFQLTTDGGVEESRQRFRDLPRREVHPEVRSQDGTIDGPAGPIPIRMYWPPANGDGDLPVVVFIHGGGWSVATNLAGLPSAYIAVAGHDPLRDDGARYAELLAAAGVPVELHNAETLVHGYVGYAGVVPAATEATERGLSALRKALELR